MGEKEGGERGGYERGEGEGEREGEGSKGKGRERGEREGEWGVGEGEGSKGKGREGGEREGRVGEERDRGRGWSVSSHAVTHSRTHKQAYTLAQTNKQTLSLKHTLAPPPNTHTLSPMAYLTVYGIGMRNASMSFFVKTPRKRPKKMKRMVSCGCAWPSQKSLLLP